VIPILLPVEILSMFTKPFALCIRLFANMTAGHVVILSLISLIFIMKTAWFSLISVPFAVFVYCLEILVAFLQAFIFTLLTAYFIGMSAHPSH
jgi:F-type H+-transporting ATPase subunit a